MQFPILLLAFLAIGSANISTASAQQKALAASHSHTSSRLTESQKVQELITYVRSMKDATFIRNGSKHSCKEAADHLQAKWEKHKADVKTARGFIDELASKSGMSGKDYLIQYADGRTETSASVLNKKLKQLEK
ncbi:DUF5329 family protein [Pontibacter sp. CAU 1760]